MPTIIYKATNKVNGKSYIGVDSAWPKRKAQHLRDSSNPKSQTYNYVFHKALRKHGPENFFWDVIYSSDDKHFVLNVMESRFIQENNSHYLHGNGYNMTFGGDGGRTSGMTGKNLSSESKELIASKKRGIKLGPQSPERVEARAKKLRGRKFGPQSPGHVEKRATKLRGKKLDPSVVLARIGRKRGAYNV